MRTYAVLETPIGGLGVDVAGGAVVRVSFGATPPADDPSGALEPVLAAALRELREYFAGDRTAFSVATAVTRGSAFERAVWEQIASIPYGQTRTYGQLARAVGDPGATQAVGAACGRNPVPVIVACHRVVAANGRLGGFGGGLPRKRHLLRLEARLAIEQGMDPG